MVFLKTLTTSILALAHVENIEQNRRAIPISGHAYFPSLTTAQNESSSDGLTIQTQQGPVMGTSPAPNVRQFLGIPYAAANRWEAPTAPPNRTETFNASSFGDSCPQQLNTANIEFYRLSWGGLSDDQILVPESEECLNINVWAPSTNRAQSTAVLVWIYGGELSFGTSNTPQYNGLNFVQDNDDITLVSFNYRTNIFGQPNAPQLNGTGQPQNFGFLDVDAAIQWVSQNIASFGGDPERITIFGQSAGAQLADAYTYSHPNDTIVKGVIEQSGTLLDVSVVAKGGPILDDIAWNVVASAVGCGNTTDSTQFFCMQNVSTTDLATAVSNTESSFSLVLDGVTVFADTQARAAAGNFLKVPLLAGTTANEGDIFIVLEELLLVGATIQPALDILSSIFAMGTTCATAEGTNLRAAANSSVFRYEYQAIFPNISPFPQLRAYHTSEIPLLFGTYNLSTESTHIPSTPIEIALSKSIQQLWVAFARDPANALPLLGWPAYNGSGQGIIAALGNSQNQTGWTFTESAVIDALCPKITFFQGLVTEVQAALGL
ncbi:carboxylesterase [Rhodocollybia butyracea]|uniref:Carboxylic ester hydrolase n=1 Tax=Rhodocollybia butyracea TaxID=206335 RepID=A0A9P5Q2N0_9AGAR|nr:carboxylesterase [Rhodocollybia butyracea]